MLTLKYMLKAMRLNVSYPGRAYPRMVYSKPHRHGERILILVQPPVGFFTLYAASASCWKPPEERNALELISCPWQKPG